MLTKTITPGMDGRVLRTTQAVAYITIRAGAGESHNDVSGSSFVQLSTSAGSAFQDMSRGIFSFDTILGTVNISKAIFGIYFLSAGYSITLGDTSLCVTGGAMGNPANLAESDFQLFNDIEYSPRVLYSDIVKNAWTTFTFNANGIAAINKTGYTIVFLRDEWDLLNSGPAAAASKTTYLGFSTRNAANKPYLYLEYEPFTNPPVSEDESNSYVTPTAPKCVPCISSLLSDVVNPLRPGER